MVPFAQIVFSCPNRLRLKIAGRRGDQTYFGSTANKLASAFAHSNVRANALTGSIVLSGDGMDARAVADFGRTQGLFDVQTAKPEPRLLASSIISPLQAVNRNVKVATDGRLDMPGSVFFALLLFGIVELVRGNWKSPPWYTAFWYAFGLYSKSLFDEAAALKTADTCKS